MNDTTYARLTMALTEYDRRQSKTRWYNPHALGIYLERAQNIRDDVNAGADFRAAIVAGFSGKLVDFLLRKLGLPITTNEEQRGGWFYRPVAAKEASHA
jgi:hypothetical protein